MRPLDGLAVLGVARPDPSRAAATPDCALALVDPGSAEPVAVVSIAGAECASPADLALRLAGAAAGRRLLWFDAPRTRERLGLADAVIESWRELGSAADLCLFAHLARPDWDDHGAAALLRRLEISEPEPADAAAAAAAHARLLGGLRQELAATADADELAEFEAALRGAGAPEAVLAAGLSALPRGRFDEQPDVLLGPARDEPREESLPVGDGELLDVFGPGGRLAENVPGYRVRDAQVALARSVAAALNGSLALLAEAGTGVGKSLGYLVPAALFAARNQEQIVVATKTKNLQAQLYAKDLPVVVAALALPVRAALLKGRADYLCLQRLRSLGEIVGEDGERSERLALLYLQRFARLVQDGDLGRASGWILRTLAPAGRMLDEVRCEHGASGRRCSFGRRCCYPRAAQRAATAHVVVANHALALSWPKYLPPATRVIFDEAHDLVDSASDAFGVAVGNAEVRRALARVAGRRRGTGVLAVLGRAERRSFGLDPAVRSGIEDALARGEELGRAVDAAAADAERFALRESRADEGRESERRVLTLDAPVRERPEFQGFAGVVRAVGGALHGLSERYAEVAGALAPEAEDGEEGPSGRLPAAQQELLAEVESAAEAFAALAEALDWVLAAPEGHVTWIEWNRDDFAGRARFALRSAPIDVGAELNLRTLGPAACTVLTSATLRVDGEFAFHGRLTGFDRLDPARRLPPLALGSPFDYERQLRFFVPLSRHDPLAPAAADAARAAARALFLAAVAFGGRTLGLFNSRARMLLAADLLRAPLEARGIAVLCPGQDGSTTRVLQRFRAEPRALLIGARSFWEGVDVPNSKILCTVMERIPFESPADPIHAARSRALDAAGRSGFRDYSLPRAIIRLLQGAGRIVRSERDRGAVVLLDPRVATHPRYGSAIRRSLPATCEVAREEAAYQRLLDLLASEVVGEPRTAAALLAEADREFRSEPRGRR